MKCVALWSKYIFYVTDLFFTHCVEHSNSVQVQPYVYHIVQHVLGFTPWHITSTDNPTVKSIEFGENWDTLVIALQNRIKHQLFHEIQFLWALYFRPWEPRCTDHTLANCRYITIDSSITQSCGGALLASRILLDTDFHASYNHIYAYYIIITWILHWDYKHVNISHSTRIRPS